MYIYVKSVINRLLTIDTIYILHRWAFGVGFHGESDKPLSEISPANGIEHEPEHGVT